jgi:hypothetical protein
MQDRMGSVIFTLMVAALGFMAGALVVVSESPPHGFFRDAYSAATALKSRQASLSDRYGTDQWYDVRRDGQGVTLHDAGRAQAGYTLYTSGDSARASLIDLDGNIVHEWVKPFSQIWHKGAAVARPQPDEFVFMRKVHLYPNGDLLAIYEAAGDTPYGYGLAKLDRNGEVLWTYLQPAHHDFDLTPDGRIVLLTHEFVFDGPESARFLNRPYLDDFLVVLSPDGKELAKVSLVEAVMRSPFEKHLHAAPHFSLADPLHTNSVVYVDGAKARNLAIADEGQAIVSFRDIGVLAVVDIAQQTVTWASRGPWVGQHDPKVLDNGELLLFDNLGNIEPGNASRILQFNPVTMEITWQYAGDPARAPLDSPLRSEVARLPNGNTLITESDGGRLLEVTPSGEPVWEYVNPVRSGENSNRVPVVTSGQRITPDTLEPDFLQLITTRQEHAS